jgi:hypothetical protein
MLIISAAGIGLRLRLSNRLGLGGCTARAGQACVFATVGLVKKWTHTARMSRVDLERLSPGLEELGLEAGDHGMSSLYIE